MKFIAVFSCVLAVAFAKPSLIAAGHGLAGHGLAGHAIAIVPGAPIGHDGRVVDTPEVAHAKIAHAAAHVNEKVTLNNELLRSADHLAVAGHQGALIAAGHGASLAVAAGAPWGASLAHSAPVAIAAAPLVHSAPVAVAAAPLAHAQIAVAHAPIAIAHQTVHLGPDGRPLDNPDVAHVKAAHAAAHVNDKLRHAEEANRNLALGAHSLTIAHGAALPIAHAAPLVAQTLPIAHSLPIALGHH